MISSLIIIITDLSIYVVLSILTTFYYLPPKQVALKPIFLFQNIPHPNMTLRDPTYRDTPKSSRMPIGRTSFSPRSVHRNMEFHGFGELFNIAIYNSNYGETLHVLYDNVATRRTIIQIAGGHKDWKLTGWLPRLQINALQLELNEDGKLELNEILLYKEPLFVSTRHPERTPCTYMGTSAGP